MKNIRTLFRGSPLLALFLTIFIDMLGVGILIPVFPLLIMPQSPDSILPAGWTIQQGFILFGWLSATYPIAQFFAAPILGQLADRYGRKKVLAFSIAGTAIGYILFAIAIVTKNIPLLFASRALDGITGGNVSVAQAGIADISNEKNRARNFGLIGMAFGLGFILGPYIGGKLADPSIISWFSAQVPFYFTAIISVINVILVLVFLPETLKVANNARIDVSRPFRNIISAFSKPGIRSVMPSSFLFTAGFTFFTTFFAIVLAQKYGFSQGKTGDFFAYIGLWIALVQGGLTGLIAKKFKDYRVLRISLFISAISLLGYFFIPGSESNWLYLVPPVMAIGNGLTSSFNSALISRISSKRVQGEALGLNSSVMALAQSIPPIIAGYVATIDSGMPIFIGSMLISLGGIAFWIFFKPGRDDKIEA